MNDSHMRCGVQIHHMDILYHKCDFHLKGQMLPMQKLIVISDIYICS